MKKMKMIVLISATSLCALDKNEFEQRKNTYRNIHDVDQLQARIDSLKIANEGLDDSLEKFKEQLNKHSKQKIELEQQISKKINSCSGLNELKSELSQRMEAREKLAAITKETIINNGRDALESREKMYDLADADRELDALEKKINKKEQECPDLGSLKNKLKNKSIEVQQAEARVRSFLQNINENEELIAFIKTRIEELKNQPIKNEMPAQKPQNIKPIPSKMPAKKTFMQRAKEEANKALKVFQKNK